PWSGVPRNCPVRGYQPAAVADVAAAALPPIAATLAPLINATGVLVHMFPGTLHTPRRHGVTRRCTTRWNLAWWRGHEGAAGHGPSPAQGSHAVPSARRPRAAGAWSHIMGQAGGRMEDCWLR